MLHSPLTASQYRSASAEQNYNYLYFMYTHIQPHPCTHRYVLCHLHILDETYIFTGGRQIIEGRHEDWTWVGTLYHVTFTKWFPGELCLSLLLVSFAGRNASLLDS